MADNVIGEIEEIKNTDNGKEIHWKIPHFASLSVDCYYKCPDFKFLNIQWNLKIGPYEMFANCNEIALLLKTGKTDSSYDVMCTFGIKKADGSITGITSLKHTLHPQEKNLDVTLIVDKFFTTSELFENESELLPSSNLTIMCNLKLLSDPEILAEFNTLSKNIKDVFTNEELCDVTLHVQNEEFKAHKVILAARSPVFAAMFKHETSEKQTGVVNIPDCDPDSFRVFLEFLYSGKFERELHFRCFVHLYKIADKYSVEELSEFCIENMQQNLKVENVFDVIAFAEEHDNMKLFNVAKKFFNKNLGLILATAEWSNLTEKNVHRANNLLREMLTNVEPVHKRPRLEIS